MRKMRYGIGMRTQYPQGYNKALGVNHMVLNFHWVGMPQSLVLEQMQAFAEEVMPKVEQAL